MSTTTGLSETVEDLMSKFDSNTRVVDGVETVIPSSSDSSVSKPFTLSKHKDVAAKPNKKQLLNKYQYPNLVKQMEELNFRYELDMEEVAWTAMHALSKSDSIQCKVCVVVREMFPDLLGDKKKKEYLIYYTQETGLSKRGLPTGGVYIVHGIDKFYDIITKEDEDGDELPPELGQLHEYRTELFTKEKLQEILEGQDTSQIQFSYSDGNKSYAGYNEEEFLELDQKEIAERGRLARTNEDLSVRFSDLSTKDKLYLEKNIGR